MGNEDRDLRILNEANRYLSTSSKAQRFFELFRRLQSLCKLHFIKDGEEVDVICECEGGQGCSCKGECKEIARYRDIYFGVPMCQLCIRGTDIGQFETVEDYNNAQL